MSDDNKPFSRPKGSKGPRGGKPDGREKRSGKPGFGGKPRRDFTAERSEKAPGERIPGKPFRKRTGEEGLQSRKRDARREDPLRERGDRRPGKRERDTGDRGEARTHASPRHRDERSAGRPRPGERERGKTSFKGATEGESENGERIAKRLARAGISSRRDAEALITAGRVRVNGKVLTSPAFNVRHSDLIELDGAEIPPIERTRLFLFHKPAGVVTTNRDPEGRKTVFDILPKDLPRLMTVGRLDINTEGLLLLTNDGGLSRVLELPSTGWLRRYRARVHGKVDAGALEGLKQGIAVDGVFYGAVEASLDREQGSNAWLTLGLREGKNREVKNILGALGLEVSRLIRISYGPFQLGDLPEGSVQELKGRMLRDQLGQRLIEESGANFSAPVATPFSNRPVRQEREQMPERAERPKVSRDGERGRIGEGGLIKNRKRQREDKREDALGRLQTSRPERPKGFKQERGKPGERDRKRDEPQRSRSSNVWMAPGARPEGKDKRPERDASPSGESPRGGAGKRGRMSRENPPSQRRDEGGRSGNAPATRPRRDDRPRKGPGGPRGKPGPRKGPQGR